MRVTQSMISNNTLRNISDSYSKLAKLNEQNVTGKKFNRPSDDPVAAMRAMGYRTDLSRVQQYQNNISEAQSWVDATDDSLNQVGLAMQKIRELTVQASNGTLDDSQKTYIAEEMKQLKGQIIDISNSQIGGKYIFGGNKTDTRPSDDYGKASGETMIEVFSGITLPLNYDASSLFTDLVGKQPDTNKGVISDLIDSLEGKEGSEKNIDSYLSKLDKQIDKLLAARSQIGARQNRVELMDDRLSNQEVFSTRILSDNEDVDQERVIMDLTLQESVHRAALGIGAKIMQPSLMDFLR